MQDVEKVELEKWRVMEFQCYFLLLDLGSKLTGLVFISVDSTFCVNSLKCKMVQRLEFERSYLGEYIVLV